MRDLFEPEFKFFQAVYDRFKRHWEPITALASLAVSIWATVVGLQSIEAAQAGVEIGNKTVQLAEQAIKSAERNALIDRIPMASVGKRFSSGEIVLVNSGLGPAQIYQVTLIGPLSETVIDTDMDYLRQGSAFRAFFANNYPQNEKSVVTTTFGQATGALPVGDPQTVFRIQLDEKENDERVAEILRQTTVVICFADFTGTYYRGALGGDFKYSDRKCPKPEPLIGRLDD